MSIALDSSLIGRGACAGGAIRKEQSDARLNDLGRAGRQHVQLHHEVAAPLERPGPIGRLHERGLARSPAVDILHLVVGHRGEARLAIAAVQLSRHP